MDHESPETPALPNVADISPASVDPKQVLGYNPDTNTYRVGYDSTTDSLCHAIISAVSIVNSTDPMEMPPLYSVIDPDALEAFIKPATSESGGDCHVSFTYAGYTVSVHSYGIITIEP